MTTSRSALCSNASGGTWRFREQMAIVGFNDLEFMASSVPTLSSVRTNRYEMGKNAAAMVIATLEGRRPDQGVVDLGFSIVQRESSKRP